MDQILDPQAVADLMAALERVFKIGVYYPSGHSLCDQATDQFMRAFEKTLGKAPALKFDVAGGILSLQDTVLDPEVRGVLLLLDLMDSLGIAHIEMDSSLTATDLYEFVTGMIAYRNRLKGTKNFQKVVIEEMPSTITVLHLEFIATDDEESSGECSGDTAQPKLETLMGTLRRKGLNEEQIEQCRQLMRSIPGNIIKTGQDQTALPQVTWKDVEKLLLNSVLSRPGSSDDGDSPSPHINLDTLTAIFGSLGKNQANRDNREAIDLLLSIARRDIPTDFKEGQEAKPRKAAPASDLMPMAEIREAIDRCKNLTDENFQLMSACQGEELTVLCQLLLREQKISVHNRIQKQLRDILRTPMQPSEWSVLVAGARQLLEMGDTQKIHGPMVLLTNVVRGSEFTSCIVFLRDVAAEIKPDQLPLLWPFLVNEMLLEGSADQGEAFGEIASLAAGIDQAAMQEGLETLQNFPSLKNRTCSRNILANASPGLFQILAKLLDWPPGIFLGPPILAGLCRKPPNWLCAGALPLLSDFKPEHRKFLVRMLEQAHSNEPTKKLVETAGRVVAGHLPGLPRERRNEPWVPTAVGMVVRLRMVGSRRFLKDVLQSKRFLVIPEWPKECRQAAAETLEESSGGIQKSLWARWRK